MSALTELQGNSDAAASSPEATQPPPASTDASTSAAAAAMLDKLALLDEARKQERERRREETRASADPRESVACFLKGFASRQRSVEDALQRMLLEHQQLQGAPNGTNSATQAQSAASSSPSDQHDFDQQQQQQLQVSAANPESVAASLELLTSEALQMEQSAAAASYYLPLYDQKQCANTVAALRAAIEAARGTLAPRKRFTFGSKKVNKVRGEEVSASAAVSAPPSSATASSAPHPAASTCSAAAPNAIPSTSTSVTPASSQTHGSSQQADRTGAAPGLVVSEQDRALVARGRGLLGLYDTVVVRRAEEVAGGDFVLLGLTRCTVVLLGQLPALRMVGLRGCRVVAGPVTGACFVDDVQVGAHEVCAWDACRRMGVGKAEGKVGWGVGRGLCALYVSSVAGGCARGVQVSGEGGGGEGGPKG